MTTAATSATTAAAAAANARAAPGGASATTPPPSPRASSSSRSRIVAFGHVDDRHNGGDDDSDGDYSSISLNALLHAIINQPAAAPDSPDASSSSSSSVSSSSASFPSSSAAQARSVFPASTSFSTYPTLPASRSAANASPPPSPDPHVRPDWTTSVQQQQQHNQHHQHQQQRSASRHRAASAPRPPPLLFHSPQLELFQAASSPIPGSQHNRRPRVLEVGARSGLWAIAMAEAFPGIDVVAVDDNPEVFGSDSAAAALPPNVTFVPHLLGDPLPFPNNTFDLVRSAWNLFRVTEPAWRFTVGEMARVARNGGEGFLDVVELYRISQSPGPKALTFGSMAKQYFESQGINPYLALRLDSILEDAGAIEVTEGFVSLPINWHPPLGAQMWSFFLRSMPSFFAYLRSSNLVPADSDLDKLVAEVGEEYRTRRAYFAAYFACGRM
ncbi:S-adenosyl-L-methionine-dependent methyltransferase [Zopfochytrium polystomum]|nr:S-adenosyl-L-methionine-dependent methyltransferase [Zopfochytrium polystomum]